MATIAANQLNILERGFDSFEVTYFSQDLRVPNPRHTGTESGATIIFFDKNELAGAINFYEQQPLPINRFISSSRPHISLTFHISRFNDIMNVLRKESALTIWFDHNTLDGGLGGVREPIGQQ